MLPMKAAKDGQKVYQSVCVDGLRLYVRVHSVSLSVCSVDGLCQCVRVHSVSA